MNYEPDELAEHIIINKCTIRECAKHFGISKSYTCKLIHKCSDELKEDLENILNYNISQRSIRGAKALWEKKKAILGKERTE